MVFENIVGKGENSGYQNFRPFAIMYSILSQTKSTFDVLSANDFNVEVLRFTDIQLFPKQDLFFYVSPLQVVLKTLLEMEKLLIMSNFSFSHSVFYSFWEYSAIFIKFEIVVCKFFQFGRF